MYFVPLLTHCDAYLTTVANVFADYFILSTTQYVDILNFYSAIDIKSYFHDLFLLRCCFFPAAFALLLFVAQGWPSNLGFSRVLSAYWHCLLIIF